VQHLTKVFVYKSGIGLFGGDFAKESRKTKAYGETLKHFHRSYSWCSKLLYEKH